MCQKCAKFGELWPTNPSERGVINLGAHSAKVEVCARASIGLACFAGTCQILVFNWVCRVGWIKIVIMDARSAMRPCYILPMFFIFFYSRLSWPNGWTDLHETFTRGRYQVLFANVLDQSWPSLNYTVGQKMTKFCLFFDPTPTFSALTPERGKIS